MKIVPEIAASHDEFVRIRHDIHKHPELAFEEFRTADLVAQKLDEWGIDYQRGIAVTGIVAWIKKGHSDKAIGLRADMDALAMNEANCFGHRSVYEGKFHGCGHDGHTTMLLAAAKHLKQNVDFDGTVYLIFQPAEEGEGGAIRMIEEGIFDKFPMDSVYGLHNFPDLPVGNVQVLPGPFFASFDSFKVTVVGCGGHGAYPEKAIDPVPILCQIILAWQTLASRHVSTFNPLVISTTIMDAGRVNNVIPERASAEGAVRTLDTETRRSVELQMKRVAEGIAAGFDAKVIFDYEAGYPVLVNTLEETERCEAVARRVFGADHVSRPAVPVMGSEDFAAFLQEKPGCYILLGNGAGEGTCMIHNPDYDFNDEIIPMGASYWSALVETLLASDGV